MALARVIEIGHVITHAIPAAFPNVTDKTSAVHKVKLKRWLGSRTISAVVWSADPTGPAFTSETITEDTNTTAKANIASFSSNVDYLIRGKVTASDGEIEEFRIPVKCLALSEVA